MVGVLRRARSARPRPPGFDYLRITTWCLCVRLDERGLLLLRFAAPMKSGASFNTSPRRAHDQHTTAAVGKANMAAENTTGLSDIYFSPTQDREQRGILSREHTQCCRLCALASAGPDIHLFRQSSFRKTVRHVKHVQPWEHDRQKAVCAGVCNACHLSLPSEELPKE
ncbi:uncharacterized protein LOC142804309 [Rhipicephalus microplus]|uniref:uncharacterized protein LOC142804309 n=1 Tax=Rhipicephalus microplus TaxID=6941 RepID=UPI003F6C1C95